VIAALNDPKHHGWMTWVIGAASQIGYAVGSSDVCVTFSDGSTRDCLQKIYPVTRFIAVGFAGSAAIGFAMLDEISRWLAPLPDNMAWIPDETAEMFPQVAKTVWDRADELERAGQSDLMMLAAHPTAEGLPGHAICFAYIFRSPDFVPIAIPRGRLESIGCGSEVEAYNAELSGFSDSRLAFMQGEEMKRRLGTIFLEQIISDVVKKKPTVGVSPHFHICRVERGGIEIRPNDYKTYNPDDRIVDFKMPPVARSRREFQDILATFALPAAGAIC
jgi:hypothetical protein